VTEKKVTIGDTGENSFEIRILTPDGGNLHMLTYICFQDAIITHIVAEM